MLKRRTMKSVEMGGMLQSLFLFFSPFALWPQPSCRGPQCKRSKVKIKIKMLQRKNVFGELRGMWLNLTSVIIIRLHCHANTCLHTTYHIQGSDTYQMPGAEPGLFISPETAQTPHTVVIIDYNNELLNHFHNSS